MHRSLVFLSGAVALLVLGSGCRTSRVAPSPAEQPQADTAAPVMLKAEDVHKTLADAVKSFPSDPNAQLELAMFDLKTNAVDAAEQEMLSCWKQFPRFARVSYQLGLFYLTRGRAENSLPYLRAASELSPDDAHLQYNLGLAYFQMGDEKHGIEYAKRAIKIDPLAPEPYLLLARCNDHHGTANTAVSILQSYLERSGDPAPGYYLLGRIYSRQDDPDHAQEYLQRAVQADPNNPEYWVALGRVYFKLLNSQQAQKGIECYEKALALEPNNWHAHQYLGHALLDQQQYETAIVHLRAALQNCPDPGPLYYDLSQALMKAGHAGEGQSALATYQGYRSFHEGVTRLNNAIVAAPRDRTLRYALVRFCLERHQPGAAQSVLDEIVRQQGTDAALKRLQTEVDASRAPTGPPSSLFNAFPSENFPGAVNRDNPGRGSAGMNSVTGGSADRGARKGGRHGN